MNKIKEEQAIERAIDIALQVIRLAKPDRIVNLGDTCDFPEWSSKFLVKPERRS